MYIIYAIYRITCAISEFESSSLRGVLDTIVCDQVCQCLGTGQWFSPGNLVSSTNKTDRSDKTHLKWSGN
jgi:hypothetical protein